MPYCLAAGRLGHAHSRGKRRGVRRRVLCRGGGEDKRVLTYMQVKTGQRRSHAWRSSLFSACGMPDSEMAWYVLYHQKSQEWRDNRGSGSKRA